VENDSGRCHGYIEPEASKQSPGTKPPSVFAGNDKTKGKNMSDLATKECVPCKGGVPPLQGDSLRDLQQQLGHDWNVVKEHHLEKEFKFRNFREALAFTNKVGELAESVNHHPDIYLAWGLVRITLWTHKIDGLTESDFIMAAKIETLA
jgi:4a-hydroxytetrahydrobiopterin dehydratase